ncbi:putative sugar phosphate transporter domain-containing protein [Dioscorea sansibarensis]
MGVLDSLLGRDGKKFMKRKDSDAGEQDVLANWCYSEAAKWALEELRSAMYNGLHTSEGAKRQQQRHCSPAVALTFNFMVAVGIIMANKLVMGRVGFNFPVALSLIHYATAWLLMAVFKGLAMLPASPPSKSTPFSSLFALGVVMSFSTGLANISLKHNSIGFYQMAKIAVTPTIVLAEFILFGRKVSIQKVLALTVVSIGVAVATVTDLQFNFFGACVALAWIVPSAINKILWSNLQQTGNWTALALMWKTTPVTIFFLLALMPLLDPAGVLSFNWNVSNTSAIFTSALLGFLLQWSGALALGATSATTHVVLGQFKTCVILLGGYLLFNSDPGAVSICGAIGALCGMSVYTYLNLNRSHESTTLSKQLPRQNSFPSLPPRSKEIINNAEV